MRYDTLLERHGIDHVDLFVLDVEGHELSVLRGMIGTKVWPRVFCIEHGNIGVESLQTYLTPWGTSSTNSHSTTPTSPCLG